MLVIDTETGGLQPDTCGLCEVSACVCERSPDWSQFEIKYRWSALIAPNPELLYTMDALAIQGRTMEDLQRNGWLESRVLQDLTSFVRSHMGEDLFTVSPWAWNAQFDMAFIEAAYQRHGRKMPCNHSWRCGMHLFRIAGEFGLHDEYRSNLEAGRVHCGVAVDGAAHGAARDCEVAALSIGVLMRRLKGLEIERDLSHDHNCGGGGVWVRLTRTADNQIERNRQLEEEIARLRHANKELHDKDVVQQQQIEDLRRQLNDAKKTGHTDYYDEQ